MFTTFDRVANTVSTEIKKGIAFKKMEKYTNAHPITMDGDAGTEQMYATFVGCAKEYGKELLDLWGIDVNEMPNHEIVTVLLTIVRLYVPYAN